MSWKATAKHGETLERGALWVCLVGGISQQGKNLPDSLLRRLISIAGHLVKRLAQLPESVSAPLVW
jgi:hypothetical protein